MKVPATTRQRELLSYVRGVLRSRGYVPAYSEICRALGLRSKATVAKHVRAIERQGIDVLGRRAAEDVEGPIRVAAAHEWGISQCQD